MSFRVQVTNKYVDPSRANIQADDYTTVTPLSNENNNTHPTSNTTFTQETPRYSAKAGQAIRVTATSSEDFM